MGDEISGDGPALDLLGDPYCEPKERRGRHKHPVTEENRSKVKALRACGWLQRDIAVALDVSEPTLREYYFSELDDGPARERASALMKLRDMAYGGNVSAMKVYLLRLDGGTTLPKPARSPEERQAPRGKKEQLRLDAASGHEVTGWGSLLPN